MTHPAPTANLWDTPETRDLIRRALEEDIGSGDRTSRACVPEGQTAHGRFLAKQNLVVAGTELLPLVFGVDVKVDHLSGKSVERGTLLASVSGSARLLL